MRANRPELLFIALAVGVLISPGQALSKVSEDDCQEIRALSLTFDTKWIAQDAEGGFFQVQNSGTYTRSSLYKLIYVHRRSDQSKAITTVGIKISYKTEDNAQDKDQIIAQNNYKRQSIPTTFKTYQDFHLNNLNDYDIKTNFHLTSGILNWSIPFTTFAPDRKRRQMAYGQRPDNEEWTYRAYLFRLEGVSPLGSCVDFELVVPFGATQVITDLVDLEETKAFSYDRARLQLSISP